VLLCCIYETDINRCWTNLFWRKYWQDGQAQW